VGGDPAPLTGFQGAERYKWSRPQRGQKNEGLFRRKPTNSLGITPKIAFKLTRRARVREDQGKKVWPLFFLFSNEKEAGWLAGEAGPPRPGKESPTGEGGAGREGFPFLPFLAAPERAALVPRGRAPEGLGLIGGLYG